MRLIDADVADKWMRQNNAFIDAAILKAIPTIDAVPVVRCRECVNHSEVDGYHYCKFWRMYCPDDSEFYCKAAKPIRRKENRHRDAALFVSKIKEAWEEENDAE